jgi:hypothetical protein
MAAPNYQGEKRRRDLAKQAKKREKEKEKAQRKLDNAAGVNTSGAEGSADASGSAEPAPGA